jgi:hypothetical protein
MVRGRGALRSSPLIVALFVLALYAAWIGCARVGLHHRTTDFAFIGSKLVHQSDVSPAIDADAPDATSAAGYDGQFFLYIAQDPLHAKSYTDGAAYRYGRILYPLLARGLALGRQGPIPFMLVAINVAAVALGTFALGALLRRRGRSPWWALVFALYPGVIVAVERDLSEALAYGLALCAVSLFDRGGRRDLVASSAIFAIAALTRESTLLFALVCIGLLAARDRGVRRALPFGAVAVLPYLVYREVVIREWIGNPALPASLHPTAVPFGGLAERYPFDSEVRWQIYTIVLPGALCLVLAVWALVRRCWDVGLWALAANALAFVVLVPTASFDDIFGSSRITIGVVAAFVISIPPLTDLRPSFRWWGLLVVLPWMAAWWLIYDSSWFPGGRHIANPLSTSLYVGIQGSSSTASRGQEVDFTVWSVDNDGFMGFGHVVLRIELTPGLKLLGPPSYERGSGCRGTRSLTCALDSLRPGMGTPVRFGVRLGNVSSSQSVTASLSADGAATKSASFAIVPG